MVSSNAPRSPLAWRIVPLTTGKSVTRGGVMSPGVLISTVTSRWSISRCGRFDRLLVLAVDQRHAVADRAARRRTSGIGSAAAAISAAIFGPAALASFDQPAVSRILTKVSARRARRRPRRTAALPGCRRRRAARRRRPCRESARARRGTIAALRVTLAPRQARRTASPSSGMVSSQEQIRMLRGRSAIGSSILWFLILYP